MFYTFFFLFDLPISPVKSCSFSLLYQQNNFLPSLIPKGQCVQVQFLWVISASFIYLCSVGGLFTRHFPNRGQSCFVGKQQNITQVQGIWILGSLGARDSPLCPRVLEPEDTFCLTESFYDCLIQSLTSRHAPWLFQELAVPVHPAALAFTQIPTKNLLHTLLGGEERV